MTAQRNTDEIVWESLSLVEVPVKIAEENFVLTEASANDARAWRANNFQSLQTREIGRGKTKESVATFTGAIADSHILLVHLCLSRLVNGVKKRVATEEVRKWPNKLIEILFLRAQEISGLRDEEEEEPDSESNGSESNGSVKNEIEGKLIES